MMNEARLSGGCRRNLARLVANCSGVSPDGRADTARYNFSPLPPGKVLAHRKQQPKFQTAMALDPAQAWSPGKRQLSVFSGEVEWITDQPQRSFLR